MNVKVIMEARKDNFESEIEKYLTEGYKIHSSTLVTIPKINSTLKNITKDYKTIISGENVNQLCFYALMIKDI